MKNYILKGENVIKPFQTLFLCGAVFEDKEDDKRVVLKKCLDSEVDMFDTIILEQHFVFAKYVKGYLSYDNIFMNNLHDIETMMALLSDKIIVIHESISTAAELGIFASNAELAKKMCVLVPNKYCIEEEKLSAFIRLAFLKPNETFQIIEFFPITMRHKVSMFKKDYHTFFANNEIGTKLKEQVLDFLRKDLQTYINIKLIKLRSNINSNELSYYINKTSKNLKFNIPVSVIEVLILSLISKNDVKSELRKCKKIVNLVNELRNYIKTILRTTIQVGSSEDLNEYKINYEICMKNSTSLDLNKAIGYILYVLQARGYILLPDAGKNLKIKTVMQEKSELYSSILEEYQKPKQADVLGYLEV